MKKSTENQKSENMLSLFNLIANKLTASELISTNYNGSINYMQSAVENFAIELANELNKASIYGKVTHKEKTTQLVFETETSGMTINILHAKELAEDLAKELKIDWLKTGLGWVNWTLKQKRTWLPEGKPAKEYWHTLKPIELAECFESKEEFLNDRDRNYCLENLETANRALEFYKAAPKTEAFRIKAAEKMVKVWQANVDAWSEAEKIHVDYELVKENKRRQKCN